MLLYLIAGHSSKRNGDSGREIGSREMSGCGVPTLRTGGRARAKTWAGTQDIDLAEGYLFLPLGEVTSRIASSRLSRAGIVMLVRLPPLELGKAICFSQQYRPYCQSEGPQHRFSGGSKRSAAQNGAPERCARGFTKLLSLLGPEELKCNSRGCR